MIAPSDHIEEELRLRVLHDLGVLDTKAEERFDRITRLLSLALGVPIALVSLIDAERQWFKSKIGLDVCETQREHAFCAHAIVNPDSNCLVIPDATTDLRFHDNPLVVGAPFVRFYAGQVLRDRSGLPMGTLCAIDTNPRTLNSLERDVLRDFAAMVEEELQRGKDAESLRELSVMAEQKAVIFRTLTEGIVLQGPDGNILMWNSAAEGVLGLTGDELSGRKSIDPRWGAIHDDGTPWSGDTHPAMEALRTAQPVNDQVMGVNHPNGHRVWLRVNSQPVFDTNDNVTSVVTAFSDFTVERALLLEQRTLSQFAKHAADIITVTDRFGAVRYQSPSFERVLGFPVSHDTAAGAWGSVHPDDLSAVVANLAAIVENTSTLLPCTFRVKSASGDWVHLETVASNRLDDPEVNGIVFTSRDVSERERINAELAHHAAHDELTDLPNRRRLAGRVTKSIEASRGKYRVAACFADLDGFNRVNDTYGHQVGDALLKAVANTIRMNCRPGDYAARVGGDEFVIILDPVRNEAEAMALAANLRAKIAETTISGLPPDAFDNCIGVALSRIGDTYSSLLHRADTAMYVAKTKRGAVELERNLEVECA